MDPSNLKFMFSKKATKIDEIVTAKMTMKILSIFVDFSENVNSNDKNWLLGSW